MNNYSNQDWLIIGNGPLLSEDMLKGYMRNRKVVALDGAVVSCLERGLMPDFVLGDFDSIDRDIISELEYKHNLVFIYLAEQDRSDLEKGLRFISSHEPKSVIICQAIGARSDHTIHNMRLLKRLHSLIKDLSIINETEKIYFIKDQTIVISSDINEPMALLSFPHAVVSTKGLQYDMQELSLEFAKQESISNHFAAESARIQVKGEVLLIISQNTEINFS